MKKKKLVVMDMITQSISVYEYDENIWESPEHFETEEGEQPIDSNVSWMLIDELTINFH